jgi:carbon monoxide dehydrogenase subunit G
MRLESKTGKIEHSDVKVYNFLSNFNNIKQLIPEDKVSNWQSDENSCRFSLIPIGETIVKIIEQEPYKLIKLSGIGENKFNIFCWVQLKQIEENNTRIKLTLEVVLNPILEMMAKKPLQDFLNKLVDRLSSCTFENKDS